MEEQVSFLSQQQAISGVLHLPDTTPAPGVVMCHGFTGHKAETHRLFVNAARDLAQHGLTVLRFDFRGSGDSAGEFRDMTISGEIADASAALDFLASHPQADPNRLALLGLSMGGCVAACLAGRDVRVRALVLWAAAAHPERLFNALAPEFAGKELLDYSGWGLGRRFLEDLPNVQPLNEVKGYAGPSLVIHGSNDQTVPPDDASDFRLALGGRCRRHLIQGADHVFSSLAWKSEVITLSREFLLESFGAVGQTLPGAPAAPPGGRYE
jgi:alpha/beta superfamily hydrolase